MLFIPVIDKFLQVFVSDEVCDVHGVGVFSGSESNLNTFRHILKDKNLPVACAA